MKKLLTLALLAMTLGSAAQNQTSMKTVRQIYPQWQGGHIAILLRDMLRQLPLMK